MTAPTVPASRVARDLLALIPDLHDMDAAELMGVQDKAAREFTACTLHASLPVERQGDTDPQTWALRAEWAEAARDLWLAVQAEREARR